MKYPFLPYHFASLKQKPESDKVSRTNFQFVRNSGIKKLVEHHCQDIINKIQDVKYSLWGAVSLKIKTVRKQWKKRKRKKTYRLKKNGCTTYLKKPNYFFKRLKTWTNWGFYYLILSNWHLLKYDKEIFWESLSFIGLHSYKIIWSQGSIPKISGLLKDEKDQPSTNNCYGWLISIYYSTFLYV